MSSPRTPFEGIQQWFDQFRRQFEVVSRGFDGGTDRPIPFDVSMGGGGDAGVDLADHGDEFVLTVDVPGYEREDLDVRLAGDRISIGGEREHREESDDDAYIRRERRSHSFSREFTLPRAVDPEDASATVRNGVLTVRLPKRESGTEEPIEIE